MTFDNMMPSGGFVGTSSFDTHVIEALQFGCDKYDVELGLAKPRTILREKHDWTVSENRLERPIPTVIQLKSDLIVLSDTSVL